MGLWKRVSRVIKDRKSVVSANFSGKDSFRCPVLEAAIVNATSHDDRRIDRRKAQIVFSWIRASEISLRPLLRALSGRMGKMRSWINDVYTRIRIEITKVLLNVYSVQKPEAAMALKILREATAQGEELESFFELCTEFGPLNTGEIPTVTRIPEEQVEELQKKMTCNDDGDCYEEIDERSTIVVYKEEVKGALNTVITGKWEVFDENTRINEEYNEKNSSVEESTALINRFPVYNHREIPDLICF
ncbi:hypothetical protein F3Y22_tig00112742pilonHSYRG00040 [Hibiscus syriacus]|uniref:AP180 N-terminal homology (ANTH) domain-containing protein n=1 Tax=Hibiscus syriacus TaxID=106335 RepID=A0A6A2WTK7_HIBSY|nr:hypothetical protein F3Y22_tig00112742pilonHSYRG00040 [Hibiscus syriacus]